MEGNLIQFGVHIDYEEIWSGDPEPITVLFIPGWQSSPKFYYSLVRQIDVPLRAILIDITSEGSNNLGTFQDVKLISQEIMNLIRFLNADLDGIISFSMYGASVVKQLLSGMNFGSLKFLTFLSLGPCLIDTLPRHVFWNILPRDIKINLVDLDAGELKKVFQKGYELIKSVTGNRLIMGLDDDKIKQDIKMMIQEIQLIRNMKKPLSCISRDIPIQVIAGELDEFIPIELTYKTVKLLKNTELEIIPFAGHFFPIDYPDLTAESINQFLEKVIYKPEVLKEIKF
ncbi:MAG: alpha/beta fold hydrolase [Promethearchaeota archaeon]